jgi:hypothetical protein
MVQVLAPARAAEVAHARECDEAIAAKWAEYWTAMKPVDAAWAAKKEYQKRVDRDAKYTATHPDAFGSPEAAAKNSAFIAAHLEKLEAKHAELAAAAAPLAWAAQALDQALYTGWQRFFLVEHIHRSQHCSSFREGTRIGWLPKVSGLTEAEAVAEYGPVLCSICFPSAPVELTNGQLKDGRCEGSGTQVSQLENKRTGFYAGNWGQCPTCGKHVGIGRSAQVLPKHKA